ncbi:MAG: hypothetical protein A2V59_07145 [Armatimonadetes bacterium RBG_19FT_COMBO_69_19]|nr:MAG: hypothetical protein A2V59_07145 [Armatimonadetes bacterium RBG_19FT_COMBO_69_19]
MRSDPFRTRVLAIVRAVPRGRLVTYGQVALLAGKRHGAREVGWIAHAGGEGIPWQRVVNRFGGLAAGFTGGREGHRMALRREGVRVGVDDRVDLGRYLWWPDARTRRRLGLGPGTNVCWEGNL